MSGLLSPGGVRRGQGKLFQSCLERGRLKNVRRLAQQESASSAKGAGTWFKDKSSVGELLKGSTLVFVEEAIRNDLMFLHRIKQKRQLVQLV